MRIRRRLFAIAVLTWALPAVSAQTLAHSFSPGFGESRQRAAPIQQSNPGDLLEQASLTFVVSVCLADLEYTLACREVGLLEAAKRLEQIYRDVYAMRRAAGSLKIWFPAHVPETDQLHFLREVEDRAIAAMAKNLENGTDQSSAALPPSPGAYGEDASALQTSQAVRKWREAASEEAGKGTNWLHDWASRTHLYRTGQALHELAVLDRGNH